MVNKTVAIHVFFDDMLKSMNHRGPESRKTTDAEIITVALPAAGYFAGNIEKSLCFVRSTDLMPGMPGKRRFNRRLHQIGELLSGLFFHTGQAIKELNIQHRQFSCSCLSSYPYRELPYRQRRRIQR